MRKFLKRCRHEAMLTMAMLMIGCPAHVIIGDSLKVECREKYVTPMAVMAGWWN